MKQCPQCNEQFTDAWISFCPNDGAVLREFSPHTSPPAPVRERPIENSSSEQPTMWLPRQQASEPGWVAPDERQPMFPVWQPPPPPYVRPLSQGLAIGSMITGILGLLVGLFCLGPIPGIVALVLGLIALSQIKKYPDRIGGKPFAIVGLVTGSMSVVFYGVVVLYVIIAAIAR